MIHEKLRAIDPIDAAPLQALHEIRERREPHVGDGTRAAFGADTRCLAARTQ